MKRNEEKFRNFRVTDFPSQGQTLLQRCEDASKKPYNYNDEQKNRYLHIVMDGKKAWKTDGLMHKEVAENQIG